MLLLLIVKADSDPLSAAKVSTAARAKVVLECLAKSNRPAKVSGVRASIKSLFKPALDGQAVSAVLQSLQSSKKVTIEGTKVTYASS